jgi:alanyl-tRNA synthetase
VLRAHSAMHVLKGAVVEVLGPKRFTFASEGVLKFGTERPLTAQEASRVETAANRKVSEDAEILEFEMDRVEAEGHFGRSIHDLRASPTAGGLLRIARIPDWEVSCCSSGHVESTGSVGAIKMDSAKFDESKKELELRFHVL